MAGQCLIDMLNSWKILKYKLDYYRKGNNTEVATSLFLGVYHVRHCYSSHVYPETDLSQIS